MNVRVRGARLSPLPPCMPLSMYRSLFRVCTFFSSGCCRVSEIEVPPAFGYQRERVDVSSRALHPLCFSRSLSFLLSPSRPVPCRVGLTIVRRRYYHHHTQYSLKPEVPWRMYVWVYVCIYISWIPSSTNTPTAHFTTLPPAPADWNQPSTVLCTASNASARLMEIISASNS